MSLEKYTGYHGTDKTSADNIMRTNFIINYKHTGWLGTGVYFFEENLERAVDWARFSKKGKITGVIEVVIEVPPDAVFDSTREDHENEFHELRNSIINENLKRGKFDVKAKNYEDFDGKVYNMIANLKNASLIRAKTFTQPFAERGMQVPRSRVPNAVELCLKSTKYVKSKSKVSLSQRRDYYEQL